MEMKYLYQLASLLSDDKSIDGYTDEAAKRKQRYGRIGKKAMKELASYLGLVEFDISFNRAGPACSGDLRLMGFDHNGRGVYIHMNKDLCYGSEPKVLYRTIEHMKDFTGGPNHYFPVSELAITPELIRGRMLRLHGGKYETVNS